MERKTPVRTTPPVGSAVSRAAVLKQLGDDPEGKDAVVTETKTKTYREPAPKKDEKANQTANSNAGNKAPAFNFETKTAIPVNKLAELFQDMAEYEEEEGEIFYALLIRRPDLMSDNFRKPCLSPQNFQPLQVSSKMMLQFIPMIQKYNGNSGGRFDIVICDTNGESLEIGISGYTVPDPLLEEVQINSGNGSGGLTDLITLIREEQKANRDVMLRILEGKEDEFTKLAKDHLRQQILNPPQQQQQPNGYDPAQTVGRIMESVAVTQAMAEGFAGMFNKAGGGEREKGLLESLLNNEMLVTKAQEIYEHTTGLLADVVLAKTNPAEYMRQQQQNNPTGFSSEEPYPPLQSPPVVDEEANMKRQQVIAKILTELESDSVLDDKNVVFIELKEQYPDIYDTVMLSCKSLPFNVLVTALETLAPDVFTEYYESPGVPNEKGTHVVTRLKAFTEFLQAQP